MATLLQKAIELAVKAHAGQEDPPGEPYIVHPLRVMLAVSQSDDPHRNEMLRCVSVLHDAVERGGIKPGKLRKAGMPTAVVKALELMTHEDGVPYADYVVDLKANALARMVKIADLLDNADLRHVTFRPGKTQKDVPRLVRYAASYRFLTDQIEEKAYRRLMEHGEKPAA